MRVSFQLERVKVKEKDPLEEELVISSEWTVRVIYM